MPKLRKNNNAVMLLDAYKQRRTRVFARYMGICRATINSVWVRYDHTGSARDRPRSGRPRATVPAQDWYIRLMHLRDGFSSAPSTASQIPGLIVCVRMDFKQGDLCDITFSRRIISLNDFGDVNNIFDGDVQSGEQFSLPMNLASCCSK